MGTIEATTTAHPGFSKRIQLIFENVTATITGSGLDARFHDGSREGLEAEVTAGRAGADPVAFPHDHHLALITDFIDVVEADRDPPFTGEHGPVAVRQ